MRVVVVDGQGGGLGRGLIEQLRAAGPSGLEIIAAGTNSAAVGAMLKAGADAGATGENAILYCCSRADVIAGPIGIILANSMWGEITPAIASAISESDVEKVLIPVTKCRARIAGVAEKPMAGYLADAVELILQLHAKRVEASLR